MISLGKIVDTITRPRTLSSMAPNPPWSDLPVELLSIIASFLTSNPFHIITFRSVCKSWRSSSFATPSHVLSDTLPLTTPPPFTYYLSNVVQNRWCVISVTVVCCLWCPSRNTLLQPNSWICFVDQWDKDKVSIRKPFPKAVGAFPQSFPYNFNLLDFGVSELSHFYNVSERVLNNRNTGKNIETRGTWYGVSKVILSSNISAAVILTRDGTLKMIRLQSCEQWEIMHDGMTFRFDDIVEFKGMLLGIDRRGRVYDIESDKPFTTHRIISTVVSGDGRRKRLVESLGELYLVVRCNVIPEKAKKTTAFKVYKLLLNVRKKLKWRQVCNIGERIFFFDSAFSFSTSIEQLCGVYTKSCILYNEHSFHKYRGIDEDNNKMFGEVRNTKLRVGVFHFEDPSHIGEIGSYPNYSKQLWPWGNDINEACYNRLSGFL